MGLSLPTNRLRPSVVVIVAFAGALAVAGGGEASNQMQRVVRIHNHVTCSFGSSGGGQVVCHRADGIGKRVILNQKMILVRTRAGKTVYSHKQPTTAASDGGIRSDGISYKETHNHISCYWSTASGGSVGCIKSNNQGFVLGLTHDGVFAGSTKIIYSGTQP
jgi:hypothetical protein